MAVSNEKVVVTLSPEDRKRLESMVRSRKFSARQVRYAKTLLLADEVLLLNKRLGNRPTVHPTAFVPYYR